MYNATFDVNACGISTVSRGTLYWLPFEYHRIVRQYYTALTDRKKHTYIHTMQRMHHTCRGGLEIGLPCRKPQHVDIRTDQS